MLALRSKLKAVLSRYLSESSGQTALILSLAAVPVIGSAGAAIDYGRYTRAEQALQSAVDGAALAAAAAGTEKSWTISQKFAKKSAVAEQYLAASLSKVSDVQILGTPKVTVGPNTLDIRVDGRILGSLTNVFSGLRPTDGGPLAFDLSASSKVAYMQEGYLCLLAMHQKMQNQIYFQGNSEFMANCSVHANSDHTVAIRTWGSAYAEAESFCARGGWSGSGYSTNPQAGCGMRDDPYKLMTLPSVSDCNYTNTVVKKGTQPLTPGTYCGGLSISTGGIANLAPGLYVIKDGKLDVDSQSTLNAPAGVTIYLTGSSSSIDIKSGATVTLVAPNKSSPAISTKDYIGFAIMQDRESGIGNTNQLYSKGGVNITGTFYTPAQNLKVWANGDMNANSSYFPMIVNSLEMNGDATLYVKFNYEEAGIDEPTALKVKPNVFVSR